MGVYIAFKVFTLGLKLPEEALHVPVVAFPSKTPAKVIEPPAHTL